MADNTVTELISAALRKIGAISAGETPSAGEMSDALISLRHMLRQWSSKSYMIFVTSQVTHTLTGAVSYTIGSGATINTTRPTRIKNGYVTSSGLDYQLKIIDEQQYSDIASKSTGSDTPEWLWYNPGYSTGTIYLFPAGSGTLTLNVQIPLTDPTTLTEDITFPGEYDMAIVWGLACELALEYGKEPTPYMLGKAEQAKDDIIAINAALSMQTSKLEITELSRRWSIEGDG